MCRCEEGWVPKNWCFQTVVLEKTLESPLDSKESKSVNPKRNQPWIFIGRNAMTNLDSVLKSRGTSLLKKVHIVKNYGTHSSTLAWKLPWMEESGRLQSMGSLRVGHDWETSLSLFLPCIGEGNGNPLQCSCLENPRDGEAWWAAVCGVAQSRTRLTRLSSSLVAAWFFQ